MKKPPQNLEAEACVLGSLLLDNDAVAGVSEFLQASDFYDRDHRSIFEVILGLYEENRAVDAELVKDRLSVAGKLEDMGGVEALISIMEKVPSAAHVLEYAEIVRDRSMRRRLISLSNDVTRKAFGGNEEEMATATELMEYIEGEVFKMAETGRGNDPVPIDSVLKSTVSLIEKFAENRGKVAGCATEFYDLDNMTGGFQGGDLIILAARPSVGKTTFTINCAMNTAVRHNKAVAFFSLEMSKEQIASNMLCALAEVQGQRVRHGDLRENDWAKIVDAAGRLHKVSMHIDDSPGLTPAILRGKCRRLKRQGKLDIVFIDYLQLMDAPRAENRQQQISTISRGLKSLARELEVPVVALSQINRSAEKEERRPRMSDLRESGAIEQDADLIMFLYDPMYQKSDESAEAPAGPNGERDLELILAKQRNGPTGKIGLQFARNIMKFRSKSHDF